MIMDEKVCVICKSTMLIIGYLNTRTLRLPTVAIRSGAVSLDS